MGEIAYTGASSGKGCKIHITVQKLSKCKDEKKIKKMAEEIKEKCAGKTAAQIKAVLKKDVKGIEKLPEAEMEALVADLADTVGLSGAGHKDSKPKKARYGDQKISKSLYDKLRLKTPSEEIQDMVNENIELPMNDPALPGMIIELKEGQKHALEADHIVSMKRIVCMEGFDQLTFEQQVEVLNYRENFVGLSKSANTSKGSKSFKEWTIYKKENIEVEPEFRRRMIEKEERLEGELQELIDNMLKEKK